MTYTHTRKGLLAMLLLTASLAAAQGATYQARLSVVPLDVAMQSTIAGRGEVRGTLEGSTLVLSGRFSGLRSSATVARLHLSAVRGTRGAARCGRDATVPASSNPGPGWPTRSCMSNNTRRAPVCGSVVR